MILIGMIATITKDVPRIAVSAIQPMFDSFVGTSSTPARDFDWVIHPGGAAILHGAKQSLQLTDEHIRASLDVYKKFGNSSSPSVLIVLDKLRRMGDGRDDVVATSFGPGLMIEMCMLKRWRRGEEVQTPVVREHGRMYALWLEWQSRLLGKVAGPQRVTGKGMRTSARWHAFVK